MIHKSLARQTDCTSYNDLGRAEVRAVQPRKKCSFGLGLAGRVLLTTDQRLAAHAPVWGQSDTGGSCIIRASMLSIRDDRLKGQYRFQCTKASKPASAPPSSAAACRQMKSHLCDF